MSVSSEDSNPPLREMRIGPEFQSSLPSYETEYKTQSNSTLLWYPPSDHIPDITLTTQEFYEKGYSRQRVLEVIFRNNYDVSVSRSVLLKEEKFGTKFSKVEKNNFELGYQEFEKRFDAIQSNYLSHKTIPEIVGYYHTWKRDKPVSKVDLKLECYFENLHCDPSSVGEVDRNWQQDGVNDNVSVDIEELKTVMMDRKGDELEQLEVECENNKIAMQVNSHSIRLLKSTRCYEEIEKMRPQSFHTSKHKQAKKCSMPRKRLNNAETPEIVSNCDSPKRAKYTDEVNNNKHDDNNNNNNNNNDNNNIPFL